MAEINKFILVFWSYKDQGFSKQFMDSFFKSNMGIFQSKMPTGSEKILMGIFGKDDAANKFISECNSYIYNSDMCRLCKFSDRDVEFGNNPYKKKCFKIVPAQIIEIKLVPLAVNCENFSAKKSKKTSNPIGKESITKRKIK